MPAQAAAPQWEEFEQQTLSPALTDAQRDGLRSAWYAGFLAGLKSGSESRCGKKYRQEMDRLLLEVDHHIRNKRKGTG